MVEVIEGPVQRLRLGTEVSGTGNQVTTSHVATFQLGKVPVRMEMPRTIILGDGDTIAVGGVAGRDGVFNGLAYRNHSTGARDQACGPLTLVLALVALVIGLGALGALGFCLLAALIGGVRDGWFMALLAAVFTAGFGIPGVKGLRLYAHTMRASGALR